MITVGAEWEVSIWNLTGTVYSSYFACRFGVSQFLLEMMLAKFNKTKDEGQKQLSIIFPMFLLVDDRRVQTIQDISDSHLYMWLSLVVAISIWM